MRKRVRVERLVVEVEAPSIVMTRSVVVSVVVRVCVTVVVLDELEIVVVRVAAVAEAHARKEFVRLRNLVDGFDVFATVSEAERLPRAARSLCRHGDLVRGPRVAAHAANPPAWGNTVLEYLDGNDAMARVDSARGFVRMRVRAMRVMIVVMVMPVVVTMVVPMRVAVRTAVMLVLMGLGVAMGAVLLASRAP